MADYSKTDISGRLKVLGESLAEFPEGASCPYPVARIFNELVKQARREVEDDPVLKSIRYLEEAPNGAPGMSNTLVTTVRALVDQVVLSVDGGTGAAPTQAASGEGQKPRPAPPSSRRR